MSNNDNTDRNRDNKGSVNYINLFVNYKYLRCFLIKCKKIQKSIRKRNVGKGKSFYFVKISFIERNSF